MSSPVAKFISYRALMGQVVVRRRQARQISQQTLAAALGITQTSLSRLESGQSAFSVDQLAMVARALGVPLSSLTSETDAWAERLTQAGHNVVQGVQEAQSDWTPLVGAALVGALLALAFNGK